jgi:hypothetical protein
MPNTALQTALVELLRPLVRYLVGHGWGYPALCDLLKGLYVAEAATLDRGPGRPTDSRLSLRTGIHRREVKRLRKEWEGAATPPSPRRDANLAARVVATWISAPEYLDAHGGPRVLALHDAGDEPGFEALVRRVKADVRPRSVLDELVRVGVAAEAPEGVRLLRTAYVSPLPEEKLEFLAANVGDHLRSALHNLSHPQEPYLERALYHDAIPAADLDRLRPELMRLAEPLLREANRRLLDAGTVGTEHQATPRRRMRLGLYYYEEDTGGAPSTENT